MNYPLISLTDIDCAPAELVRLQPGLLRSIEQEGVLSPVWLEDKLNDASLFRIIPGGGYQRIQALIRLKKLEVPALIFPPDPVNELHSLHENEHRTTSTLISYQIIQGWVDRGFAIDAIAEKMCLSRTRVKYLLNLKKLSPILLDAIGDGIGEIAAMRAAKLSSSQQKSLEVILKTKGRIRNQDVDSCKRVQSLSHVEALPDTLFAPFDLPEDEEPEPPEEPVTATFIHRSELMAAVASMIQHSPTTAPILNQLLVNLNLFMEEP